MADVSNLMISSVGRSRKCSIWTGDTVNIQRLVDGALLSHRGVRVLCSLHIFLYPLFVVLVDVARQLKRIFQNDLCYFIYIICCIAFSYCFILNQRALIASYK